MTCMKTANWIICSIFLCLLLTVQQAKATVSGVQSGTEIPEKREFILDLKVSPCDDFHQYVCGSVEKSFKLREDRSAHTFAFDDSDERILEKKKTFFKNIENEKKLPKRAEQMRNWYMACMNEKEAIIEEQFLVKELKSDIEKVKSMDDFIKLNVENISNEKWSFSGFGLSPNISKPTDYDIYFDIDFMFLPEHSYYDNKDLIEAYIQLMAEFLNTIYPDEKKSEHLKRAEAVVNFEKRFIKTYPYPAEFRQRWTQPRYVDRNKFLTDNAAFQLESLFKSYIPKKTLIRDFMPESFTFAQIELEKEKNLQALKDMYIFRSARSFMDDAYPELYKKRLDFSFKYLGGSPVRPDRQERCTNAVMGSFGLELDQEMMPRLFPNFPKKKMLDTAAKVRASIIQGLKNNKWLSEKSRKAAIEKTEKAKLQLIQPYTDKEWDFKPIQSYSATKPYENAKKLSELGQKMTYKKLREGVNQQAWGMGPLTVNAYYDPTINKFVMPIGILQYPFFVSEGDLIENLGAVGTVIAHELGHGIDDQGSKFDVNGKLKQWMTDEDVEKFKARGQKLSDQFSKIGHNGSLTLGENVADLVGVTFAYNAAFPKGEGAIGDKQKFFVAYARLWCGQMREKTKEKLLKTDPHSLGYARINEQVKHQKGFYEAFSCNSKNKLFLPEADRLEIW